MGSIGRLSHYIDEIISTFIFTLFILNSSLIDLMMPVRFLDGKYRAAVRMFL